MTMRGFAVFVFLVAAVIILSTGCYGKPVAAGPLGRVKDVAVPWRAEEQGVPVGRDVKDPQMKGKL